MKKFLAMLLVLVTVFSLCACGKKTDANNGVTADGKIKIQVGLGSNAKILDFENNALTNWLEETCGIEIEIVEYAGGTDVATQISATIAARQELPDVLWGVSLGEDTVFKYGKEGYLANLLPYYQDYEGASKTFWTRIQDNLTDYEQEYILQAITDPDSGNIYSVPTVETSLVDGLDSMAWINQKWLDKLGKTAPTNPQELYDILKAFKDNDCNGNGDPADEIPLFGSQNTSGPAKVVNWLLNMFVYYNDHHLWQDYDGDGKIEDVRTTDAYREGLKFVNKLYKEKLLTTMVYTASSNDMKSITTPNNGTALCGIFLGHLTSHTTFGNKVMYEYVALKPFGCATERDISCNMSSYITETAVNRGITDKCFEMLMTMWSWDGSMRIRYGAKGINWDDPTPGAKSDYGLDATYKMIDDPFTQQNDVMWGKASGSFNHYAEGETAEMSTELDEWTRKKSAMHAEARKMFDEAAQTINPTFIKDPFLEKFNLTTAEEKEIDMKKTNMSNVVSTYTKNFVTSDKKMDINNDAHWKQYLDELKKEGYDDVRAMYQKVYERQIKD